MKFGNPILTSELSGSLGGVVASSARGGVGYFRVRARPGNPQSPAQTAARFILAALASAWSTVLTGPERTAWAGIAGSESSGIDALVAGNSVAMLAGEPMQTAAPASLALPAAPVTSSVVADASDHNIQFTIPEDALTPRWAVFVSKPQKASQFSRKYNFAYAGATIYEATGTTNVAIPASHAAYDLTAGDIVYVRLVPFGHDGDPIAGQKGQGQEFRVVVQA